MNIHLDPADAIRRCIHFPGPKTCGARSFSIPPAHGQGAISIHSYPNGLTLTLIDGTLKKDCTLMQDRPGVLYLMTFSRVSGSLRNRTPLEPDTLYVSRGASDGTSPAEIPIAFAKDPEAAAGSPDSSSGSHPVRTTPGTPAETAPRYTISAEAASMRADITFFSGKPLKGLVLLLDLDAYARDLSRRLGISCEGKLSVLLSLNGSVIPNSIRILMNDLFRFSGNEAAENLFCQSKAEELLAVLLAPFPGNEPGSPSSSSVRIDENAALMSEVVLYLREHIGESFTLADLSRVFCMSTSSLTATFRRATGMSVSKYRVMLRAEEARRLLAHTDFSQEEIARALGFRSVSNFSDFFRKVCGETPGAWQKRSKEL